MKIDVAKQIIEILTDKESVRVPGLGSFKMEHLPAKLSSGKKKIAPPSIDIVFTEEQGDSDELLKRIKKEYHVKKKEARKAIDTFTEKVLNHLINFDKVRITGLGMLTKSAEGEVLFKANKGFVSQFNKGLPEVKTQIVSNIERNEQIPEIIEDSKAEAEETLETIGESQESMENAISEEKEGLVTSLESEKTSEEPQKIDESSSSAFALSEKERALLAKDDYNKQALKNIETSIDEDKVVEVAAINSSLNKSKDTIEADYIPIGFEEENKNNLLLPAVILLLLVLGILFGLKMCNQTKDPVIISSEEPSEVLDSLDESVVLTDSTNTLEVVDENAMVEEMNNQEEVKGQNEEQRKESIISDASDFDKNKDRCIIITGVFKSQVNAKKMIRELKAGGYIPFSESFENNLRVGFEFDCKDVELESYLRSIRRNISRDAWYLQPSLDVY